METAAVLLIVVGTTGSTLTLFDVIGLGGGATYSLETEPVDAGTVPVSADVRPIEALPGSTGTAVSESVTESINRTGSAVELGPRPPAATPEYVRHENAPYRVDTWHVDHGLSLPGYLAAFGGWILVGIGGVVVLVPLSRRVIRERAYPVRAILRR